MKQKNNDAAGIAIDWYSFTVFCPDARTATPNDPLTSVAKCMAKAFGQDIADTILAEGDWTEGIGRRPYPYSYKRSEDNMTIYYGAQDYVLCEMSGKTCSHYEKQFSLSALLLATKHNATRLDVAIDTKPEIGNAETIASWCHYKRSKSRGTQISGTGSTFYIGSKTSDRFVRVYEYNKPNPRAGKPRIEFVLRKQNAEYCINSIAANGIAFAAQGLLNTFEFKGIRVMEHDETIAAARKDRKDSKTLTWILTQCAPAIKRLIANGTIEDPQQFFDEHMMPDEKQERMF